ncbi:hypothetical protein I2I05_11655 [Hymenobacter sp. BT683]|uniref:Uncharacterized protein n=1 Tax=Hymenobacter jeongseonensis TaxID=2791027 RepID=A0ABS0II55_9BACT|nr:hypothetical protein [Hymenobacter jeongseonensis]MBF9238050.1 hypothetical protein [Hymenobacter jeongseonensis]
MKVNTFSAIKAQVVNWMAALYAARYYSSDIWCKLLPDVKRWAKAHYTPRVADPLVELNPVWAQQFRHALQLAGGAAGSILDNPFTDIKRLRTAFEMGKMNYQLPLQIGYLKDQEWLLIVERDRQKINQYYKLFLTLRHMTPDDIDELMRKYAAPYMPSCDSKTQLSRAWQYCFQ